MPRVRLSGFGQVIYVLDKFGETISMTFELIKSSVTSRILATDLSSVEVSFESLLSLSSDSFGNC